MIKKTLLFLLTFVFCPLLFSKHSIIEFEDEKQIPQPDKIVMQIVNSTADSLEKTHHMRACGVGMAGKFKKISIEFQVFRKLSQDEARSLLINCRDTFLENINTEEKARPYLVEYPFTEKNVGITLYIYKQNGEEIEHPNICVACSHSIGVEFRTNDPENEFRFKETIRETHEEALALAKQYQATLSQKAMKE